jgi:hypothetical protein
MAVKSFITLTSEKLSDHSSINFYIFANVFFVDDFITLSLLIFELQNYLAMIAK